MRRPKTRNFYLFLSIFTILSYLTVFISPAHFWPIGLFNYLIPVLITFQFVLLGYSLIFKKRRKLVFIPMITLMAGYYFIDNTFNWPKINRDVKSDLKVLSFNARYFRERHNYERIKFNTIDWVANEESDIKCFQEYSTNPQSDSFNNTHYFEQKGYYAYTFTNVHDINEIGLAIFSRYPIVNKGFILLNENSHNNCIYADIKINDDTLRVYNFHLKSMGLDLWKFSKPKYFSSNSKETVTKLGSSSSKRAVEIYKILKSVESCPYPYILTCDMNELIYGNNYYRLREKANDTFEKVGSGFGFTFNSILFFIRIDHQFYSDGITPLKFRVLRDVKSSDHFPVKGWYNLN